MGPRRSQQTVRDKGTLRGGNAGPGTLFVVGNVIGSPEDLSSRAITILRKASIVAAETPLRAQSLLAHHGIRATITSYDPSNPNEKIHILLDRLAQGDDIALLSDSGMPVIYDPGHRLIATVQHRGYSVKVVPGPSALTAAIAVSGSSGDRFTFEGRLPRTSRRLDIFFRRFDKERRTLVFYATRSSLPLIMESLSRTLPAVHVTLAINLTKPEEQIHQGIPDDLRERIRSICRKDEVTVVLDGNRSQRERPGGMELRRRITPRPSS